MSTNITTGKFVKYTSLAALFALTCSAPATLILYDFEDSNLAPDITGSGIAASSLSEAGVGTTAYGQFTSGTETPSDTTVTRLYLPLQVGNGTAPSSSSPDRVQFTLTPDSGKTLDFSSANLSFTAGAMTSEGANGGLSFYVQAMYQVNSGSFTDLGSVLNAQVTGNSPGGGALPYTSTLNGSATYNVFQVSSGPLSLSGISGLAPDDTVTFRFAMQDSSSQSTSLNGTSPKADYFDDIQVSDVSLAAVPEPVTIGLVFLGILMLRWRWISHRSLSTAASIHA